MHHSSSPTGAMDTDKASSRTANGARAILSLAFAWVLARGWQLRHDLLSPPPDMDLLLMSPSLRGEGGLRKLVTDETDAEETEHIDINTLTPTKSAVKQPVVKPLHHPSTPLASCLYLSEVTDDSQLVDWFAYHTSVFPLTYLVIFDIQDHHDTLFETYRRITGLEIIQWTEADLMKDMSTTTTRLNFMKTCQQHLKPRPWVTFHDDLRVMGGDDWRRDFVDHYGPERAMQLLQLS